MPGMDSPSRLTMADLDLLTRISSMLTSLDRDQVLERVIELASHAVGAERSSLLLRPEYHSEWTPVIFKHRTDTASTERYAGDDTSIHFARRVLDQGLAGWVMANRQGAIITDTQADERWIEFPDGTSSARSALCVPFMYEEEVLGVLTMLHSQPDHFTAHDLQLLTIVVNQATVAVRNARLFKHLGQQKRQLEAILYAIPDTLLVLNQQGDILLLNAAAVALLNIHTTETIAADALIGAALSTFAHIDPILTTIHDIVSAPGEGQLWAFEARSSTHHDYLVTVAAWQSAVGEMTGYLVVLRDITQLRDLNRFKDEMLQMASHDLRSPLALIVGYCDLIAMDTAEGSPIHEYLDIIQRSTQRMQMLLDDLLKVEQIRNSPLELNEQIDFAALVGQVVANTRPALTRKQQTLTTDLDFAALPAGIVINPTLIREAMENLISNAGKYTADKGQVTVRSSVDHGRVYFEVQDTGIGIPKEALPRLFESFYRVKQKGTEKVEGRGLGLSLVKTVVERHNGQVWVESEPGVGSRFGFWLPIVTR